MQAGLGALVERIAEEARDEALWICGKACVSQEFVVHLRIRTTATFLIAQEQSGYFVSLGHKKYLLQHMLVISCS